MADYRVSEVAKIAGVSVRMLHHYDDIGLLVPAHTGENNYRFYGRPELLRLQQILLYREMGLSLAGIRALLDDPSFDRLSALKSQRRHVAGEIVRLRTVLRTIDHSIAELEGDHAMKDEDLYSAIVDPKKQTEYEEWLAARFGPLPPGDGGESPGESPATPDQAAQLADLKEIEQALVAAMRDGLPPEARALDPLIARHRNWVARSWGKDCPPERYAALADIYEHPDFRARYEKLQKGFAAYLVRAMRNWANRQA